MIPKKIAFFWSGGPLSWMRYLTLQTFCKFNPTWEVYLYTVEKSRIDERWVTPETQDFTNYSGKDWMPEVDSLPVIKRIAEEIPNDLDPVHQCDMFQWWWLSTEGGWYSDLDILYLQSMDYVYSKIAGSKMILSLPSGDFTIGFLGATSDNTFYAHLYSTCQSYMEMCEDDEINLQKSYQGFGVQLIQGVTGASGYRIVYSIIHDWGQVPHILQPSDSVYPFNWKGIDNLWKMDTELPNTLLGIHWFAGAKISQEMNAVLTPETVADYPCTVTRHIPK